MAVANLCSPSGPVTVRFSALSANTKALPAAMALASEAAFGLSSIRIPTNVRPISVPAETPDSIHWAPLAPNDALISFEIVIIYRSLLSEKTSTFCPANCFSLAAIRCLWSAVNRRGLLRSWSSNKVRSAIAARSCCLASSISTFCCAALASAAFCSKRVARSLVLAAVFLASAASCSALAARSCCFPSSIFASVRSLSNWRNCASWRALTIFPVSTNPAPNAKVRNNKTTPPISKNDFHHSADIRSRCECRTCESRWSV